MPRKTLNAFLMRELAASPGVQRLVVGFSGGLDSTVLLQALAREASAFALPVLAVHVHHGLSPNADAWARHAQSQCDALGIPLQICRVQIAPQGSVEAAARAARRAAFAGVLKAGDALLLAQHQDDQAETLLFRLLRGAGVRGLAAMAEVSRFPLDEKSYVPQWRPLLGVSRAQLEQWAQAEDLHWIEDESNADSRYARNFLRNEALPLLRTRWPGAAETLAATAARLREADGLLTELARELASQAVDAQQRLHIPQVLALSPAKQRLLLRYWLQEQDFLAPDEAMLDRIREEVIPAREDAAPLLQWESAEIRRYREQLYAMRPLSVLPENWEQAWSGEQDLLLPDGRLLRLDSAPENLRVTYRRGGERLQVGGLSRELKTLFQENAVPPWERERLPLVWRGSELLVVAGMDWRLREDAPVLHLLSLEREREQ
ncbi:MAG: tRNA lysidine(34) synthetase TilS [Pedobacter sp.]|nr:tRNA lysidine(34) synthetase TilS [Pedobacter sp.]